MSNEFTGYHAKYKERLVESAFNINTTLVYKGFSGAHAWDAEIRDPYLGNKLFALIEVKGVRNKYNSKICEPLYGSYNIETMKRAAEENNCLAIVAVVYADAVMFGLASRVTQEITQDTEDRHHSQCSDDSYNKLYKDKPHKVLTTNLSRIDNLHCLPSGRQCTRLIDNRSVDIFTHYLIANDTILWGEDAKEDQANRIRSLLPSMHPFVYPPLAVEFNAKQKSPTKPEQLYAHLQDKLFTL